MKKNRKYRRKEKRREEERDRVQKTDTMGHKERETEQKTWTK